MFGNLKWYSTAEGQLWLNSKEREYFIDGGKRGLIVGIFIGIWIGVILMGLTYQYVIK